MNMLLSLFLLLPYTIQSTELAPPPLTMQHEFSAIQATKEISYLTPLTIGAQVAYNTNHAPARKPARKKKTLKKSALSYTKYCVPPAIALVADHYIRIAKQARGLSDNTTTTVMHITIVGSAVLLITFLLKQVKSFFSSGEEVILQEAEQDFEKATGKLETIQEKIKLLEENNKKLHHELLTIADLFNTQILPTLDRLNRSDEKLLQHARTTYAEKKYEQEEDTGAGVGTATVQQDARNLNDAVVGGDTVQAQQQTALQKAIIQQHKEEYARQKSDGCIPGLSACIGKKSARVAPAQQTRGVAHLIHVPTDEQSPDDETTYTLFAAQHQEPASAPQ